MAARSKLPAREREIPQRTPQNLDIVQVLLPKAVLHELDALEHGFNGDHLAEIARQAMGVGAHPRSEIEGPAFGRQIHQPMPVGPFHVQDHLRGALHGGFRMVQKRRLPISRLGPRLTSCHLFARDLAPIGKIADKMRYSIDDRILVGRTADSLVGRPRDAKSRGSPGKLDLHPVPPARREPAATSHHFALRRVHDAHQPCASAISYIRSSGSASSASICRHSNRSVYWRIVISATIVKK